MDTSALRHAARDLAASLSEITSGDLALHIATGGDVGDLYLRILAGVVAHSAGAVAPERSPEFTLVRQGFTDPLGRGSPPRRLARPL